MFQEAHTEHGAFGWDGHAGKQAEIRPRPSQYPARVTARIQRLLTRSPQSKISWDYRWYCGNGLANYPTGGHIHIGFYGLVQENVHCASPIVDYTPELEGVLCEVLLPFAVALSSPASLEARLATGYGRAGDVRLDHPWGMEWRTLPSWLYDPWVAYFFLAGAKLIALEFAKRDYQLEEFRSPIPLGLLYRPTSIAKLKSVVTRRLDECAELVRDLGGWDETKQHNKALSHVLQLIHEGTVWDGVDFRSNWLTENIPWVAKELPAVLVVARPSLRDVLSKETTMLSYERETL